MLHISPWLIIRTVIKWLHLTTRLIIRTMVIYNVKPIITINEKIVGSGIQTLSFQVHFTTVVNYDRSEILFSKYKKNDKKRVIITINMKVIVI